MAASLALAFLAACSEGGPSAAHGDADAAGRVHVWLTTPDLVHRLSLEPDVAPGSGQAADLVLDDSARMQTIDGFGAAFTDTSAYLLENALDAATRAQVMADLFSRPGGIGLSLMRVPMASSDFTSCSCTYSYDDGPADPTLSAFSTAHDDAYVIPLIRQAQSINAQMKLFANPWSPPAWMKTNGSMLGTAGGTTGSLRADAYGALGQYFARFLQEYAAKGVSVWGVTPQNEPSNAPDSYSGMTFAASDEAAFIAGDLAPTLQAAGLSGTKILGGDDVGASLGFAQALFANSGAASALYGTAWHCYNGLTDMTSIHAQYPDRPLYLTECSTGPTGIAGDAAQQVLTGMADWASGAVLWNLALDTSGGPKMGVGCVGCTGLVTVDSSHGTYAYTLNYYELAQFSKFIAPGAQRVALTGSAGVAAQAFRNVDDTDVVVAYNASGAAVTFTLRWGPGGGLGYTLPAGATVTFTDSNAGM